ncbi:efflux RND transporter periplasmic adaptor subunit [Undibacterium sp. TJN19]|uniref:efflux RND transporter periplasmic adaptor subunit n=1 Tax=Undibacterium sp. TJN19 TaxID=3413055 RepID=UPI003BF03465
MKTDSSSPRSPASYKLLGISLAVIAVIVVVAGVATRRSQAGQIKERATEATVPTVSLVSSANNGAAKFELPARIEAWARVPIYARVSGYLKNWSVDIGGTVKAGQLLAEIDTPDLDQQLLQAQAEANNARSNLALATSTAKRWQSLLASDAVSKQEADEKAGDLAGKQSAVNALQANVERVQALKRYTRLTAPFAGVVTARNTDTGALINVGGAPGSELFVVSDIQRLRVYVNVPQSQVAMVHVGGVAQLSVRERPGRTYAATVQSLAQAIDPRSGAMLVQLAVENQNKELLPGGFATLSFETAVNTNSLNLPPAALIFGKNGTQVATLGSDNRVLLKPVTIARDFGSLIEIAGGIDRNDRVINSPPDGISTGELVRLSADSGKAANIPNTPNPAKAKP